MPITPSIKRTEHIIAQLQKLAEDNQDIEVVWLYGSRATGKNKEHSDYDIAIAFKNFKLSSFDKYLRPNTLAIEWCEITALSSVQLSVVDLNQVPVYLAFNIVEYGKVIYQGSTARAFTEQDRIYAQYEYQKREAET